MSAGTGDVHLLFTVSQGEEGLIETGRAWGLPGAKIRQLATLETTPGGSATLKFEQDLRGLAWSHENLVMLGAPLDRTSAVKVQAHRGALRLSRFNLSSISRPLRFVGEPMPASLPQGFKPDANGFLKEGEGRPIVVRYSARQVLIQ